MPKVKWHTNFKNFCNRKLSYSYFILGPLLSPNERNRLTTFSLNSVLGFMEKNEEMTKTLSKKTTLRKMLTKKKSNK